MNTTKKINSLLIISLLFTIAIIFILPNKALAKSIPGGNRYKLTDNDVEISLENTSYIYNGLEKKPKVTVKLSNSYCSKYKIPANKATISSSSFYYHNTGEKSNYVTYSNNIEPGTATVYIHIYSAADGGGVLYYGDFTKTFKINRIPIKVTSVKHNKIYTYTGKEIIPKFDTDLIICAGNVLILNKDYIVKSIKNNVNAGNATVEIQGINKYTGTATFTYGIAAKPITSSDIDITIKNPTYTGTDMDITKFITIKDKKRNVTLQFNKDYKLNNTICYDPGKSKIVIYGTR